MSTSLDKKLVITSVAVMVIALTGYAALVDSAKREQSSITTIGTLSVKVTPYPSAEGAETVAITYNAPGEFDFSGWTIETDGGDVHMISADPIGTGETLVVCGGDVAGLGCGDYFDDPNTLDNNSGTVLLKDGGTKVAGVSYTAPEAGQTYTDAPDFKTSVLSTNASVDFCRAQKKNVYTAHKANVGTIIDEKSHATLDSGSIIPAFFYTDGNGVGYFDGLNWPDSTGVYANGCVAN